MSIEGIPDGWDLIGVRYAENLEAFIDDDGSIAYWAGKKKSARVFPIIRKIEKPKRYRPFNDPIEGQPLIGEVLRLKVDHKSIGVFIGITSLGFQIGLSHWKPKEAFDCFERLDGTPFGIEVTE